MNDRETQLKRETLPCSRRLFLGKMPRKQTLVHRRGLPDAIKQEPLEITTNPPILSLADVERHSPLTRQIDCNSLTRIVKTEPIGVLTPQPTLYSPLPCRPTLGRPQVFTLNL